jgi:hypothetical protein
VSGERGDGYLIEDHADGRTLIATGRWTREASAAVERPDVDGVWLNYARGYAEPDLSFIDAWPIRRLLVIDRSVSDLTPLAQLGETLEDLSLQAAPSASLDLATLPHLRALSAYWDVIAGTLYAPEYLSEVVILDYAEGDLEALAVQPSLQDVQLKPAPKLESLEGAERFPTLTALKIVEARKLRDIEALGAVATTLRDLTFESCLDLYEIETLAVLSELRFLGIEDCGRIATIKPLGGLTRLERLYAWGSTRVDDGDLSPLLHLASLKEIRMRDRREYQPSLETVKVKLGCS